MHIYYFSVKLHIDRFLVFIAPLIFLTRLCYINALVIKTANYLTAKVDKGIVKLIRIVQTDRFVNDMMRVVV